LASATHPPSVPGAAVSSWVPVSLAVPALDIDAAVVTVSAGGGQLGVPQAIGQVGWWAQGGIPGAPTGTVVLDGHVDSAVDGLGALWPLRNARPGESITLTGAVGASTVYRVDAIRAYDKSSLPPSLFVGPAGPPALVLITCGGPFDRASGHYEDNVVVYATPA
jgi:hypothetical protein